MITSHHSTVKGIKNVIEMKSLTSAFVIIQIMGTSNSAIEFYDQIATDYDQKMYEDSANQSVRDKVSSYFRGNVLRGVILDFGAGTGLDLKWQLKEGYKVIFYEPSVNMAKKANEHHQIYNNSRVQPMISDDACIQKLEELNDGSLDAVFSNFAALNSVENLNVVFSVFARKLKPNGHLICVLTHKFGFIDRMKSLVKNRIGGSQKSVAKLVSMENGHSMKVFYHSIDIIKKSGLNNGLDFEYELSLGFEDHILSHLIKR